MSEKKASVHWEGRGKAGQGRVSTETAALKDYPYSATSRFGDDKKGTNPEELIGAAHAGCFSMALAAGLERAGKPAKRVHTTTSLGEKNVRRAAVAAELPQNTIIRRIECCRIGIRQKSLRR